MTKQKEAVYQAITNVLAEDGVHFEDGMNVAEHMTKERRSRVNVILLAGFMAGTIELAQQFSEQELKTYVSGLQSNWIRKDKRLNGDTKYVAKNPGSRVGQGDPQLKALKALMSKATTDNDRAEIQSYIDARVAEIATQKTKHVEVNYDALPEELRSKFAPTE